MNTRRLTTLAMLTAIYVVLSVMTPVKVINFKLTFEAFPILAAGFLLGPADGFITGALGAFIYQLFFSGYGLTPTTPLWILPHALSGFLVGAISKAKNYEMSYPGIILTSVLSAFLVTVLNMLALYVDSKMYGYYSKALVFANLPLKLLTGALLAFVYASILSKLLSFLRRSISK